MSRTFLQLRHRRVCTQRKKNQPIHSCSVRSRRCCDQPRAGSTALPHVIFQLSVASLRPGSASYFLLCAPADYYDGHAAPSLCSPFAVQPGSRGALALRRHCAGPAAPPDTRCPRSASQQPTTKTIMIFGPFSFTCYSFLRALLPAAETCCDAILYWIQLVIQ